MYAVTLSPLSLTQAQVPPAIKNPSMLPLRYFLPGVAPVPRHPAAGAPDHLHPVAEGGTRDQVPPRVRLGVTF